MRILGLLLLIFSILCPSLAIFRSSSRGMMPSVDANSGDVIWVPIPRDNDDTEHAVRKCLFCRGGRK